MPFLTISRKDLKLYSRDSKITQQVKGFVNVLVRVTIAVMEHHDRKQLGYGRIYFANNFYIILHHQRKAEQNLKYDWNL